jgi:hypothetical protein
MRRHRDSSAARRRQLAEFAARLEAPEFPTPAEHDRAEATLAPVPRQADQPELPLQGVA